MENPIVIFGANALGRAAQEMFNSRNIIIYGFLDDNKETHGKQFGEVSVLGSTSDDGYLKLIGKKCQAFVAEDDNKVRKTTVKMLNERRKVMPVNAIHDESSVAPSAHIGHGNFINAGVVVGANAKLGSHCILHTNVVVDYEATIGEFVQIGAGSIVNSDVEIADEVFIGSGVTVVSGVTIGKGARIGAGSVVISDVAKGATVFGNPAQEIKG
jgi:sugar O-acyltransferase (sialic acid O-acetyltransferase NeuD family)